MRRRKRRAEAVSAGVEARGEIYTVTVSEQGRPHILPKGNNGTRVKPQGQWKVYGESD